MEIAVAGLDGDAAALGQSVASVQHEVQQDLLGLRLVDLDDAQVGIEMQVEQNVFADQAG